MKISVLTPTYNRATLLKQLYTSLAVNSKYDIEIEWLVMDDGSTDDTKEIVEQFKKENRITILYYYQKNQGKMRAINHLIPKATGDVIIECDSDDFFTDDAFSIIQMQWEQYKNREDIYALCFLKQDQHGHNMGGTFKQKETSMFDLYFKEGETGEKALVFFTNIRNQYQHKLEENEKFVTEARMYHQMDQSYHIIGINQTIMICEYKEDGYSKNIEKQFKENPKGYFEYFKEILQQDMKNVPFKKRMYVIKHYILFSCLTKHRKIIKPIKGCLHKLLVFFLYIPGKIKTRKKFGK